MRACAAVALGCAGTAGAAEIVDPEIHAAQRAGSDRGAAEWGVSQADWARYRELMRGRRGLLSPDADPLLVLGAHARSAEERRRLAEAFVLAEHERVTAELAFERAVQDAWRRLFPDGVRVALPAAAPVQRYAVLVDRDCVECGGLVHRYVNGQLPVDVYVRGAADDADLRAWVADQSLAIGPIVAGKVTVNHLEGAATESVPGVWSRSEDGQWQVVE